MTCISVNGKAITTWERAQWGSSAQHYLGLHSLQARQENANRQTMWCKTARQSFLVEVRRSTRTILVIRGHSPARPSRWKDSCVSLRILQGGRQVQIINSVTPRGGAASRAPAKGKIECRQGKFLRQRHDGRCTKLAVRFPRRQVLASAVAQLIN